MRGQTGDELELIPDLRFLFEAPRRFPLNRTTMLTPPTHQGNFHGQPLRKRKTDLADSLIAFFRNSQSCE